MQMSDLKKLISILEINNGTLYFLISILILNSILEVLGIGLIGTYLNVVIKGENFLNNIKIFDYQFNFFENYSLTSFTLVLICVYVSKTVIQFYINYTVYEFIGKKQYFIRNKLINIYQKKNYLDFIKYKKADISEVVFNLAGIIGHTATNSFLNLITNILLITSIVLFLIFINYKVLFLSILFFTLIYFVFQKVFKSKLNMYGKLSSDASTDIFDSINNFYDSFAEIKFLNKHNYFKNLIRLAGFRYYKYQFLVSIISIIPKYFVELMFILISIIFLFFLNLNNISFISIISVATMFIFSLLKLMPAFISIIKSVSDLNFSKFAINKVYKLYKNYKKLNNATLPLKLSKRDLEFQSFNLFIKYFRYFNKGKKLLQNTKIQFKKNNCLGIIGPSGSGKSTLLNLITLLIKDKNLKIYVNNKIITHQNKEFWQDKIGYIKQNPFFFNDTFQENIVLEKFQKKYSDQKFLNSIKKSYLYDFFNVEIKSRKFLGESGHLISGGQRQRVAIARSIYHDKEVLIFDEPTSALDNISKNKIIKQLQQLKKFKTIIIVSHDDKIKDICDVIYEIKNNKVIKIK